MNWKAWNVINTIAAVTLGTVLWNCSRPSGQTVKDDVLLTMGDSVLTLREVESRIPVGLSAVDSAELFHKIVKGWIEDMVLADVAATKLSDKEEIEGMVRAYRNRLIVMSYLEKMRRGSSSKVGEDKIRQFYEAHRGEMLCERPLVKGLLLKVGEGVKGLPEMRRCVNTASDESLDELDRKWASEAVRYDYFAHTWIDWQTVAEQIPYRFFDPDAFLSATKNFETVNDGSVYLLHITDYLPTGSEMPYEFAAPRIRAILEKAKISDYEEKLVESLVKRAIADEKLVAAGYDPVKGCMIERGEERNN